MDLTLKWKGFRVEQRTELTSSHLFDQHFHVLFSLGSLCIERCKKESYVTKGEIRHCFSFSALLCFFLGRNREEGIK